MRITLINPRENYDVVLPMGILYVGTVLDEAGHEIQLLDIGPRDTGWEDKIKYFKPDIVGLTMVTTQYRRAKEILAKIKELCPQAKYCAGGAHPSALPAETLNDLNLDFVVVGEGEYVMKEACARLSQGNNLAGVKGVYYLENGQVVANEPTAPILDLDALPIPKRELLPDEDWYLIPPGFIRGSFNWGIATITSGRGCPFNCLFCASQKVFGRGMRRRSVDNVLKEIRYLKERYDIKGLFFLDDTFTVNNDWLNEFCRKLKQEKYKLVWGCQTRGDTVTPDKLQMMEEAGCIQIDVGVESGSDAVLKKLNKSETTVELKQAFRVARQAGVKTLASFIIGNPGEGLKEIDETKKMAQEIRPDMAVFCILVPYPGTPLYDLAKQNNWFTAAGGTFSEFWANKQSETPVMAINLSPEILIKKRTELENMFVWQNHKIIFWAFFKNPKYFWQMIFSLLKNFTASRQTLVMVLKTGKLRLFIEECYQNFSYDLKVKLAK